MGPPAPAPFAATRAPSEPPEIRRLRGPGCNPRVRTHPVSRPGSCAGTAEVGARALQISSRRPPREEPSMNLNRLIVAGFLVVPLLARPMPARVQVFEAAARSAPQPSAPVVHVFVEGADVSVSEERFGTFRKVRVPGGRTAFVDERALSVGSGSSGARPANEPSAPDATRVAAPARWAAAPVVVHQPPAALPPRAVAPSTEPASAASAPADLYTVVR